MTYYLKADGIKGSVTTKSYENWIELRSLSLPKVRQKARTTVGDRQDRTLGVPRFADIEIKKQVDKSTVYWFQHAPEAKVISEVIIAVVNNANPPRENMRYILHDVLVTHYAHEGDEGGLPMETLHLNYNKLEIRFTPINKSNQLTSPLSSGYNLETAEPV